MKIKKFNLQWLNFNYWPWMLNELSYCSKLINHHINVKSNDFLFFLKFNKEIINLQCLQTFSSNEFRVRCSGRNEELHRWVRFVEFNPLDLLLSRTETLKLLLQLYLPLNHFFHQQPNNWHDFTRVRSWQSLQSLVTITIFDLD